MHNNCVVSDERWRGKEEEGGVDGDGDGGGGGGGGGTGGAVYCLIVILL